MLNHKKIRIVIQK